MTDETKNLVLDHLPAMRTMKTEISAPRLQVGVVSKVVEQCVEDIATVRVPLDRIERRLDLVDAAK